MQDRALTRFGLVVLSSLALSCSSTTVHENGGNTVDTATDGGVSTGTGGAGPTGTESVSSTGTDSVSSTGTAGASSTGMDSVGSTGIATTSSTGTAGASSTGTDSVSSTGTAGTSSTGSGGGVGMGGTGGTSGDDYWGGPNNPPVKSAGCGQPAAMTSGSKTITSSGRERTYIIDIPDNYDPDTPYRLFYASHGLGGRAEDVVGWNYFGLKTQATAADVPAIFIAPQAIDRWDETDHALFDDITDLAKDNLCVDTSRVFVTGMSFGGMITYSLSTNHQKKFRAGVGLAPANYNIWLPDTKLEEPIAWMQTTGMSDTTCPWDGGNNRGSKYIALEKAADNGCTVPETIETWDQSQPTRHICVDLEGCKTGYPVKVCTFDGGHWQFPYDEGNGEDLARSWVPVESWKFFMQF